VTVIGDVPLRDASANLGQVVDEDKIVELPLKLIFAILLSWLRVVTSNSTLL
jgi:hypothetical protein